MKIYFYEKLYLFMADMETGLRCNVWFFNKVMIWIIFRRILDISRFNASLKLIG